MPRSKIISSADLVDWAAEFLRAGNSVTLHATGRSMEPTLFAGDLLELSPLTVNYPLLPGQLVACRLARGLVIHRIDRTEGQVVHIRGDAPRSESEPVQGTQLLGTVRLKKSGWGIRRLRYQLSVLVGRCGR